LAAAGVSLAADALPAWAYGESTANNPAGGAEVRPARAPRPAPDNSLKHVPGSASEFTRAQIGDRFGPADWYPGDHPAMPEIVAHGRKPDIWACALCHYPNGKGRPENAGVAGLPVSYFIHQMNDFRSGLRKSADAQKKNTNLMIVYAKAMTDDEIKSAAEYFGAMKWTPWIKVVETDSVPKTRLSAGMFLPLEGSQKEPLGQRIIEMPERPDATEVLRDSRSGFIACTVWQREKRRSSGHDRSRQNCPMRYLPWSRFEGTWPRARYCRPLAKLSGSAALRHAAERPEGRMD